MRRYIGVRHWRIICVSYTYGSQDIKKRRVIDMI